MYEHLEKNNKSKIQESKSKGRKELQMKRINIKIPKYIEDKVSENNRVIQRAEASVFVYTVDTPRGRAVGSGTCPSGSADRHAERRAWEQAKNHVRNTIGRGGIITITFEIDTIVCRDCVRWFENTVYSEIQGYIQDAARSGKNAQVQVFVSVNDNRTQLLGAGTNWTNVGNPDIEVPDPLPLPQNNVRQPSPPRGRNHRRH